MNTKELKEKMEVLGITQYELAKRLGKNPTTVNQWFARDSINIKNLMDTCKVLSIDIKEFVDSVPDPVQPRLFKEDDLSTDEYIYVPRFANVSAGAGVGDYVNDIDTFSEDKPIKILRDDLPRDRKCSSCRAVRVKGKSMLPTFMPNEWVVFDTETSYYNGDGLYVLNYAGNLLVKRVQYDMSINSLHIISDNPQYQNFSINLSENQESINIIGEVVLSISKEI
jgi:phage repressor protein C with HTH and peptisase S24 domain